MRLAAVSAALALASLALAEEPKATVVVFISTTCPVSNNYNDRMVKVYNDYNSRGVKFTFLNANRNETPAMIETHRKEMGFPFPVTRDENNVIADRLGATVTPEVFVMDRENVLRYHGHIDDAQNPARIKVQGLRNVLDALLADRAVDTPETKAFGCAIKRVKKTT